jgi:hypothetical protein
LARGHLRGYGENGEELPYSYANQLKTKRASEPEPREPFEKILRHRQEDSANKTGYIALIKMDIDDLGKKMGQRPCCEQIGLSQQLAELVIAQRRAIASLDACEVYIGGDDLLVLSSVKDSLALASALRANICQGLPGFTASAGIVYFHNRIDEYNGRAMFTMPFKRVLEKAESLLEEAKCLVTNKGYTDERKKDAIALSFLRRSGSEYHSVFQWNGSAPNNGFEILQQKLTRYFMKYCSASGVKKDWHVSKGVINDIVQDEELYGLFSGGYRQLFDKEIYRLAMRHIVKPDTANLSANETGALKAVFKALFDFSGLVLYAGGYSQPKFIGDSLNLISALAEEADKLVKA